MIKLPIKFLIPCRYNNFILALEDETFLVYGEDEGSIYAFILSIYGFQPIDLDSVSYGESVIINNKTLKYSRDLCFKGDSFLGKSYFLYFHDKTSGNNTENFLVRALNLSINSLTVFDNSLRHKTLHLFDFDCGPYVMRLSFDESKILFLGNNYGYQYLILDNPLHD